jgi:TLC domain
LPAGLDNFYVVKLSYHFYELGHTLVLDRTREDFPEYLLHHVMTFALILFSYCNMYIPIGAAIMFVHDFSDLVITIVKMVADNTHKHIEHVAFAVHMVTWIYTRLYVFPFHIIYSLYREVYVERVPAVNMGLMNMMMAFLIGLVCMHIFWTTMMVQVLTRRIKNPSSKEILVKSSAIRA